MDNQALRQKYNPDGSAVRNHQMRMLGILDVLHKICQENDIKYWISDGTLLGAVRHGGFIPWDDDLDVQMPIADYHKFLKVAPKLLPDYLRIHTHETDKAFVAPYAKLRDLNSEIIEKENEDINYKYKGVYIDIFPVGHYSIFFGKVSRYLHFYLLYKYSKRKANAFIRCWINVFWYVLKLVYLIFILLDKVAGIKYLNYYYGSMFHYPLPESLIYPLKEIEFEGHRFNSPNNPDAYLRVIYGDYMQLPPEKSRRTHTQRVILK